jgi:hypothetical protein
MNMDEKIINEILAHQFWYHMTKIIHLSPVGFELHQECKCVSTCANWESLYSVWIESRIRKWNYQNRCRKTFNKIQYPVIIKNPEETMTRMINISYDSIQ